MRYNRDMRLLKSDLVLWISVGMATVLLLMPLPFAQAAVRWPALAGELENFSHPVMGAVLTHLALRCLRARFHSREPWLWSLLLVSGYGAVMEVLQSFVGRDASVRDFVNDVLGAVFTLLLHAGWDASSPRRSRGLIVLAALTGIAATAPLTITVASYIGRSIAKPLIWNDSWRFRRFSYQNGGRSPQLFIEEPLPDWSGWSVLEVDLQNLQPAPLHIVIRVHDIRHDQTHRDRYNGQFTLAPQTHATLRIPLELIRKAPAKRQMDMGAIRGIIVFSEDDPDTAPPAFRVSEIRLAR